MDSTPFYEFNLLSLSPDDYNEIPKFSKNRFNESSITDSAEILMYANQFTAYLKEQLQNPSDDFTRLFLKASYSGVKTQNVIDKFRPVLKKSLNDYIDKLVKEKMTSLVNSSSYVTASENTATARLEPSTMELNFFALVKDLITNTGLSNDITYKKTESYFAILYQNNVRKWIARLTISSSQITLILPDLNKNELRYKIASLNEVALYQKQLFNILKVYTNTSGLDPSKKYLYTKWGVYERPERFDVNIRYGERYDLKRVQ